jgi:lysozyme
MELERSFDWYDDLDDVRKQAIINLCFNIGITSLRKFKNANQAMADKSFSSASLHYMDSKWAKQVGRRADEVCYMIKTGQYYE